MARQSSSSHPAGCGHCSAQTAIDKFRFRHHLRFLRVRIGVKSNRAAASRAELYQNIGITVAGDGLPIQIDVTNGSPGGGGGADSEGRAARPLPTGRTQAGNGARPSRLSRGDSCGVQVPQHREHGSSGISGGGE